ncbi:MAG TPA: hypothetical protein PLD48_04445 [Bacillota bacterium]|nr:hypothetical protein [Bacillota bacterium]HOK67936.1 hypothetical protein [Bacillota bacterium]HPP84327.1 hypothetical protein [Bacillota bacterium]
MKKLISILLFAVFLTSVLSSCQVGSSNYREPWEINSDFVYRVVYDAMGGKINESPRREVYYAADSLLKKPEGLSGILIEPVNGKKVVMGWYTKYENVGTEENPIYKFDEADLWDFEKDRINDSNTVDRTLTLYARWIDPPTIFFVDADNPDNVLIKWENVDVTKTLSKPTTTERATLEKEKDGRTVIFTLLDYYFDKECTRKAVWGSDGKTIEELIADQNGDSAVYIYCKYIEGEYTRINNATELKNIKDMSGSYILAADIDLKNESWTPLGEEAFKGTFIGNGYTISNLNVTALNRVSKIAVSGAEEKSFGLFTKLSGAKFYGLNFKNVTLNINNTSNVRVSVGAFGGRAENCVFENCAIEGLKVTSSGKVSVEVRFGSACFDNGTSQFTNCSFADADRSGLNIDDSLLIIGE